MKRLKIFGPPGTGKTETLLREIENSDFTPDEVGFVTFTRAAREEALSRLGGGEDRWPLVRTLHSLCYRGLHLSSSRMVSKDDLQRFSEIVGVEVGNEGQNLNEDDLTFQELPLGDKLLRLNHLGRHRLLSLREAMQSLHVECDEHLARHFTVTYREWKNREGLMDYTDLLDEYVKRGDPLNVEMFIIDEAQDLSPLQWKVVEKLGSRAQIMIAAGDDDQAIYTWAGATADLFNDWKADMTVVLDQSYRLPRSVWELVQGISSKIETRQEKVYLPREVEGQVSYTSMLPPFEYVDDALILYRYGHRGKELAKQLRRAGVLFGGVFSPLGHQGLQRAFKAIKGSLHRDDLAAARLLGASGQPTTVRELTRAYYHDYLCEMEDTYGLDRMMNPKIILSSIHQSKGRQAQLVVLDTAMSRSSHEHLLDEPDDEHRVWYVGASRAKEHLMLLDGPGARYRYEL